jgi:hypothetical protein
MKNQLWITEVDVKEYDDKTPSDVFLNMQRISLLLDLVLAVERRAGMFQVQEFSVPSGDIITPTEVFNLIRVVASEITELKVFLGINQVPDFQPKVRDKTPGHVMQLIQGNQAALEMILHKTRPLQ